MTNPAERRARAERSPLLGVAIGVAVGTAIGVALDSIAAGVGIGAGVGMVFALAARKHP